MGKPTKYGDNIDNYYSDIYAFYSNNSRMTKNLSTFFSCCTQGKPNSFEFHLGFREEQTSAT